MSYVCGDSASGTVYNAGTAVPATVEVTFDYEVHNGLDTTVGVALKDMKGSIISDIAENLGCIEAASAIRRKLQDSTGNIIGIKATRTDLPDPDAGKFDH